MDTKSKIGVRGIVTRRLLDKDGNPLPLFRENFLWDLLNKIFHWDIKIPFITGRWTLKPIVKNTITTTGLAKVAGLIVGEVTDPFIYLALGIGTATNAGLGSEIVDGGLERAEATVSQVTTTETNDTGQLVYEWTATGSYAITEEAIYDAAAAGNCLAYRNFSAVNVESGNKFEITHQVVVAIPA
jgi:hypothetical protein